MCYNDIFVFTLLNNDNTLCISKVDSSLFSFQKPLLRMCERSGERTIPYRKNWNNGTPGPLNRMSDGFDIFIE